MSNDIYLTGEVGYDITLDKVIEKVKATDSSKPIDVYIHSEGGYVYEGIAIYNYLKSLEQEVNTIALGLVASIASVFYLAGKKRTAFSQNRILIHLPYGGVQGNAIDMENAARDMREEEDKLSEIYVAETGFTKQEALEQMREDKMFTTSQLKEKGFITELKEFQAVAKLNTNNKKGEMIDIKDLSKEQLSGLDKILNALGFSKDKEKVKNAIVKTASQEDLDFYELEDGTEPSVGDKAKLGNEDATGEVVISEILTYVFSETGGVLESIKTGETEGGETESVEALKAEIARLKGEAKNKVEASKLTEVQNSLEKVTTEKLEIENSLKEVTSEKLEIKSKLDEMNTMLEGFSSDVAVQKEIQAKKELENNKPSLAERIKKARDEKKTNK